MKRAEVVIWSGTDTKNLAALLSPPIVKGDKLPMCPISYTVPTAVSTDNKEQRQFIFPPLKY